MMTPLRAWFARLAGRATPSRPERAAPPPATRSRSDRTRLGLECLETRDLLSGGTGLTAQYFADSQLNQLKLTRTDATVNFYWGANQSPAAGVPGSRFSVRWSGYVQPLHTQTYTFYTDTDNGVRLFVDGRPLINDWTSHSAREDHGTIQLIADQKYYIEMDYYQNGGAAEARLLWSSPSQAKQVIPTSQLFPLFPAPAAGPAPVVRSSTPPRPAPNPPPTARLAAGNVAAAGSSPYLFRVTYQDANGVAASSLRTGNVRVTGPNGFSQLATLVSIDRSGNGTPRTATYRITPPGGSWDAHDNGTYTVHLQAGQVKDTRGATSAAATLGTFRVAVPAPDWFSTSLHDTGVRNLARSLDADHSLSRFDMLAIFREVEGGGVTAAELTDLRTLDNNAGRLGMPDYVRYLTNKVITADPANLHYQGRPLGNLHAGSSTAQLQMLVGKWFLGADHPIAASNTHYVRAQGSLFGSGPVYTDVNQGSIGDCYFLTALAETALRDPAAIRNMFIDNGDGTYTVRFLNNGTPNYVTVDRSLPVNNQGYLVYAHTQTKVNSSSNKLWVSLAEKAYAQLAESGWSRVSGASNSYEALAGGWEGTVVQQITGKSEALRTVSATRPATLVNTFRSGALIGMDTKPVTSSGVVPSHAYTLLGYNSSTGIFNLYNPWGRTQQMTWSTIAANFSYWSQTTV